MKILIFLILVFSLEAKTFTIANYNVQNLFDLIRSNKEYVDYIPFTKAKWNKKTYKKKLINLSRVIHDLNADIIALEEIESDIALKDLQNRLKSINSNYKYRTITKLKSTSVHTALLSKFPITAVNEIIVNPNDNIRSILEATINIEGNILHIFVNHWKSKRSSERFRLPHGKALQKRLKGFKKGADYILIGDFNSNYNEYKTFKKNQKLNDTNGVTAINHFLNTVDNEKMNTLKYLRKTTKFAHYNLWMQLSSKRRWSYLYRGRNSTPDHIIIPKSMIDQKNINYKPNSFKRFTPKYLVKNRKIFRWVFSRRGGMKHHKGKGYSDHLPIIATFSY